MSWRGFLAELQRHLKVDLPAERVSDIIDECQAQSWFKYGFEHRDEYWNCWRTCFWLGRRLSSKAAILETACGCGLNLIWFGQHGFGSLHGFDLDEKALCAARALCALADVEVNLWQDDALAPYQIGQKLDAVLALNWTYLLHQFDLDEFFAIYAPALERSGYLAIDVVDPSYAVDPRTIHHTQDWGKPKNLRRPTEYRKRYAHDEVIVAAEKSGLVLTKKIVQPQTVPKQLYILCKA